MWNSSRLRPGARIGLRSAVAYEAIASVETARSAAASAVSASIDLLQPAEDSFLCGDHAHDCDSPA